MRLFTLCLVLLATLTSHARLGETEKELEARFGVKPTRTDFETLTWNLPDMVVETRMHKSGTCMEIIYSTTPALWTDDQIQKLIGDNTPAASGKMVSAVKTSTIQCWNTTDRLYSATWASKGKLYITDVAKCKEAHQARKAKAFSGL